MFLLCLIKSFIYFGLVTNCSISFKIQNCDTEDNKSSIQIKVSSCDDGNAKF